MKFDFSTCEKSKDILKNHDLLTCPIWIAPKNARPFQLLIDSSVNIANIPYSNWKPINYVISFQNLPYKEYFNTLSEDELKNLGLFFK